VPALVEDAAARASGLNPKQVYPISFDRTAKALTVATAAFVVFSLMPNIDWMRSPEQRALAGVLIVRARNSKPSLKKCVRKKRSKNRPKPSAWRKKLEALGKQMQRGRMSKKEALLSMGQLRQELEKAADSKQQNSGGIGNLEQIEQQLQNESMQSIEGQQMQRELEKKQYEKAAEQLEKLAEKIESGNMSQQENEQAANDLEKAAKALREAGNEDAARTLEEAAKQLRAQDQQNRQQQNGQQGQQKKQGEGQQQKQGAKWPGKSSGRPAAAKATGPKARPAAGRARRAGDSSNRPRAASNRAAAPASARPGKQLRSSGSMGNSQAMRDMMNKSRRPNAIPARTRPAKRRTRQRWLANAKVVTVQAAQVNRKSVTRAARSAAELGWGRAITRRASAKVAVSQTCARDVAAIVVVGAMCGATACPKRRKKWIASRAKWVIAEKSNSCPHAPKPKVAPCARRITTFTKVTRKTLKTL
jgi:hypothetical protein